MVFSALLVTSNETEISVLQLLKLINYHEKSAQNFPFTRLSRDMLSRNSSSPFTGVRETRKRGQCLSDRILWLVSVNASKSGRVVIYG